MTPYVAVSLLVGIATLVAALLKVGQRLGSYEAHLADQDRVLEAQTEALRTQTVTLSEQDKEIAVLRTQVADLHGAALPTGDTP